MRHLILGLGLVACGGARVGGSASIVDDLSNPRAIAECATGDVKANLEIVADLRDSYHEMIVCGGLALSFDQAIVNVIANAALGRGGPSQLTYHGNGTYASANGMMVIQAGLAGASGVVPFDILDPQSYLVGITVNAGGALGAAARGGSPWQVVTHAAGALDIQFQAEGPGFAMLGLTPGEAHAGKLDLKKIAKSIGEHITVANRINVDNTQGGTTVHYILDGSPQPLTEVLDNKAVPMKLASIVATHNATGQTIRITDWTMQFKGDGSTVLDGSITLDVDGGAFPYSVKFTYPHRKEPDIQLSCRH